MTAHSVKQVQQELIRQGYDVGPDGADGFAGKNTSKAVAKFEADNGLTVTGRITSTIFLDALFNPKPKETTMLSLLPTIVQWIVSLLPGIPDDVAIVEAELKELASTDSGKVKLASALAFGKVLIEKIEAVLAAHP